MTIQAWYEGLREDDWQDQVIESARTLGWRVAHFRPARTRTGWRTPVQADGAGFPDLILTRRRDGRMIAVELKAEKGTVRDDQQEWLDDFDAVPCVEACVWRPSDMDEVMHTLTAATILHLKNRRQVDAIRDALACYTELRSRPAIYRQIAEEALEVLDGVR